VKSGSATTRDSSASCGKWSSCPSKKPTGSLARYRVRNVRKVGHTERLAAQRPRAKLPGGSGQVSPTLRLDSGRDKMQLRPSPPGQLQRVVRRRIGSSPGCQGSCRDESPQPTPLSIATAIEPISNAEVATVTSHSLRLRRNMGSPISKIEPKKRTRNGRRMSVRAGDRNSTGHT